MTERRLTWRAADDVCMRRTSNHGEMAERLKAVDSKSTVPTGTGGSNPSLSAFFVAREEERCESGRIGAPGERVGAKSAPWVRIPPSPFTGVKRAV